MQRWRCVIGCTVNIHTTPCTLYKSIPSVSCKLCNRILVEIEAGISTPGMLMMFETQPASPSTSSTLQTDFCSSKQRIALQCLCLRSEEAVHHPPGSTPLPYMVCGDPESGTDHSLKQVSAYIIWYRVHTWGLQGKCHKLFSVLFCVHLQIIHVSLKNSGAKDTRTHRN